MRLRLARKVLRRMAWATERHRQSTQRVYNSKADAGEAIRQAMGWDAVVLSGSYESNDGEAWSAYETQEECDDDQDGARAPRIVRLRNDRGRRAGPDAEMGER